MTPTPDFIWRYVCCEADRAKQLALVQTYGFDQTEFVQLEGTRDFMAQVYEARKEFVRQKALAQLSVNQDAMFDLAVTSEKLSDKINVHSALVRLADMERPQGGAAAGPGFVLTINLPGAGEIRALGQVQPVQPAQAEAIEDAVLVEDPQPRLPPVPKYLADMQRKSEALLAELDA